VQRFKRNVCIYIVLNMKRQERKKVYHLDSWSFIVIMLANCSYFCFMSLSDDIRESHTVEE